MAMQVSSFKFESCILLQFKSQKEVKIVIRCCHSLRLGQIIEKRNIPSYCGYIVDVSNQKNLNQLSKSER